MRYFFVFITLFIVFVAPAQETFNAQNKFSVQLPDEFKGKRKLLMKIVDLLQSTVPVLKDKKECINCDADYWANFFIVNPQISSISNKTGTTQFVTLYSFTAFMDVYDKNYNLLKRVYFTDSTKTFSLNTSTNIAIPLPQTYLNNKKATPSINETMSQLNTNADFENLNQLSQGLTTFFDADKFIRENRKTLIPTNANLWNVVQDIIFDIKLPKTEK